MWVVIHTRCSCVSDGICHIYNTFDWIFIILPFFYKLYVLLVILIIILIYMTLLRIGFCYFCCFCASVAYFCFDCPTVCVMNFITFVTLCHVCVIFVLFYCLCFKFVCGKREIKKKKGKKVLIVREIWFLISILILGLFGDVFGYQWL